MRNRSFLYSHRVAFISCILVLAALSITAILYHRWGNWQGVRSYQALTSIDENFSTLLKRSDLTPADLEKTFDQLSAKLSYSAPALARLGEIALQAGWLQKSTDLYEKAVRLDPQNPVIQIQYFYAHSLLHKGQLPSHLLTQALALHKTQPHAYALTNILAIHAYFSGEYFNAVQLWQKLLMEDTSLTTDRRLALEKAISKSRAQLSAHSKSRFLVRVALNPALKSHLTTEDMVFIAVKATDLALPPLVVMKCLAKDLPQEVILDDGNSMIEVPNYCKVGAVEVIVKLSTGQDALATGTHRVSSGKFTVQPGDNAVSIIL